MIIKDYTSKGIISNTIFSIGSKVIPLIISLISIPIIINQLGEEKYGALTIALVFIGYFNLFDLGLGKAITKLVSERLGKSSENEIPDIYITGVCLTLILGILGGGVFFLVSKPITIHYIAPPQEVLHEILRGITYLSLGIPFTILINSFRGLLEAIHEFKSITLVQIILGIVTYFGIIIMLFFTKDLGILFAYLSLVKVIHFGAYYYITKSKMKLVLKQKKFNRLYIKELFSFGGWVTISTIIGPIMTMMDRLLIAAKLSLESVAYYSTSNEITQRLGVLPTAVISVLFPVFSRNEDLNPEKNRKLYNASFNLILLMGIVFGVILISLGKDILSIWINEDFARSSFLVLQIITVGAVFNYVARIPFTLIQSIGMPSVTAKIHLLELPFYLALLFILTEKYGITGAAIATSLRMLIDFILLHVYTLIKLKISLRLSSLLFGACLPMVLAFYISNLELTISLKLISMSMLILLVGAGFWIKVFDQELKKRIISLYSK